MPVALRRACPVMGCAHAVPCPDHARPPTKRRSAISQRAYDQQRGSAHARGYDSRWRKARQAYLAKHPLCVECLKRGIYTPARVVDHVVPHKGDRRLFWDSTNWQALCDGETGRGCHDRKTWREAQAAMAHTQRAERPAPGTSTEPRQ